MAFACTDPRGRTMALCMGNPTSSVPRNVEFSRDPAMFATHTTLCPMNPSLLGGEAVAGWGSKTAEPPPSGIEHQKVAVEIRRLQRETSPSMFLHCPFLSFRSVPRWSFRPLSENDSGHPLQQCVEGSCSICAFLESAIMLPPYFCLFVFLLLFGGERRMGRKHCENMYREHKQFKPSNSSPQGG